MGLMGIVTTSELARRWGKSLGALANMRLRGTGPKFDRIGRTVLYSIDDIKAYEKCNPQVLQKRGRSR